MTSSFLMIIIIVKCEKIII